MSQEEKTNSSSVDLQYADIVQIRSNEEKIDKHHYFVDYIDFIETKQLRLIDLQNFQSILELSLRQDDQGHYTLSDNRILSLQVISRSPQDETGYIRHHQFQEKQILWIEWEPSLIDIPNHKQKYEIREIIPDTDAMEIVDLENKESFFIDFAFRGLPPFILKIQPVETSNQTPFQEDSENTIQDVHVVLNRLTLEGDQWTQENLDFDEEEGSGYEDDRLTWEAQIQNFSDALHIQNPQEEGFKQQLIHRFTELRHLFSTFEDDGTVKCKYAELRPLLHTILSAFSNTDINTKSSNERFLYTWFYPVLSLKRKIVYDEDHDLLEDDDPLFHNRRFQTQEHKQWIRGMVDIAEQYKNDESVGGETSKFHRWMHELLPNSPFAPTLLSDTNLPPMNQPVKTIVEMLVNQSQDNAAIENAFVHVTPKLFETTTQSTFAIQRMTTSEEAQIRSIVIFPLEKMKLSRLFLPKTTLYRKLATPTVFSNNTWLQSIITHEINPNDHAAQQYKPNLLKNKSTHKTFGSQTIHYVPAVPPRNTAEFLKSILPTTQYLIEWIQSTDDYFADSYSVAQLVETLEPFALYYENIRTDTFQIMQKRVKKNMEQFRKRSFLSQSSSSSSSSKTKPRNDLSKLFAKSALTFEHIRQLTTAYQLRFDEQAQLTEKDKVLIPQSNSEIILQMNQQDFGEMFTLSLLLMASDRLTPEAFLGSDDTDFTVEEDTPRRHDKVLVVKIYNDEKMLEKDNDIAIYADEELMDPIYKGFIQEYENKPKDEVFLQEDLRKHHGYTDEDRIQNLIQIIVDKKQPVQEGDYAVLEYHPSKKPKILIKGQGQEEILPREQPRKYWKRVNGRWKEDTHRQDSDIQNMLALLSKSSKSVATTTIPLVQVKKRLQQHYSDQVESRRQPIQENIQQQTEWLSLNRDIQKQFHLVWNGLAQQLAAEPMEDRKMSPYVLLRDEILQIPNERIRFESIIKFYNLYCRSPILDEDIHWGYCLETNSPLFPQTLYKLALVFNEPVEYQILLDQLCNQQLVEKVDNAWVDKASGYPLCQINYQPYETDSLEYYSLVLQGKERDQQISQQVDQLFSMGKQTDDGLISTLYKNFNKKIGLQENDNASLFKQILMLYNETTKNIPSEKKYNEMMKKKKAVYESLAKLPTYNMFQDGELVYSAVAAYFIIMQLHLDKLKKSNELGIVNCKFSFDGYPVSPNNDEKEGGLQFMHCILSLFKTPDTRPWNAILQKDTNSINKLRKTVEFMIKKNPEIQIRIAKRQNELRQQETRRAIMGEIDKTESLPTSWPQFLPPLVSLSSEKQFQLSDTTLQSMLTQLDHSLRNLRLSEQQPALAKMKSYENKVALFLYESINAVVRGKSKTRNNRILFLETMCCDEHPEDKQHTWLYRDPLIYFEQNTTSVKTLLSQAKEIYKQWTHIHALETAPFLFYHLPMHFASSLHHIPWSHEVMKKAIQQYNKDHGETLTLQRETTQEIKQLMQQLALKTITKIPHAETRSDVWQKQLDGFRQSIQSQDPSRNPVYSIFEEHTDSLLPEHFQSEDWENIIKTVQENIWEMGHFDNIRHLVEFLESTHRTYYKNAIRILLNYMPNQMMYRTQDNMLVKGFSHHYGFSENHYKELAQKINKHRQFMEQPAAFQNLFQQVQEQGKDLLALVDSFPETLFNETTLQTFYSYLFVETLYSYIEVNTRGNYVTPNELNKFLGDWVKFLLDMYQVVSMPYETIIEKTRKDVDKERNDIMQQLSQMSDEQRKSENMMKFYKLDGVLHWDVGSEIFKYNKQRFDYELGQEENDEPEGIQDNEEEDGNDVFQGEDDDEYEGDGM